MHKTAGLNLKTPVEGAMSLTPVIDTLRKGRYIHIGKLLVWNFGVDDAATIAMVTTCSSSLATLGKGISNQLSFPSIAWQETNIFSYSCL